MYHVLNRLNAEETIYRKKSQCNRIKLINKTNEIYRRRKKTYVKAKMVAYIKTMKKYEIIMQITR